MRLPLLSLAGRCHRTVGRPRPRSSSIATLMVAAGLPVFPIAAELPSNWQFEQHFQVEAQGLVRMSLPPETLDAARPGLEDLRVYDDAGHELPFLVQPPPPPAPRRLSYSPKSFQASLGPNHTVLTIETGMSQGPAAVTLETPARGFIKAVSIEGSQDGNAWQSLARGQVIFRQEDGIGRLDIPVPLGSWNWLRLTIDDQRSGPIPFTGARLTAAGRAADPTVNEPVPVTIVSRQENGRQTRLMLDLSAANLDLTSLQLATDDPLFTRSVKVAVRRISDNIVQEQVLAEGAIYRVAVEGQPPVSNLTLPLQIKVPARQVLLLIENQDSPPLNIKAVSAQRRPILLVFLAGTAGLHHLLTGNQQCPSPAYDLAALAPQLKAGGTSPGPVSHLASNPRFQKPEVLPEVLEAGTSLDTSGWRFRKPIIIDRPGPQQVELDLDVLAHAMPGFADLRLVRGGRQMPYILEHTSLNGTLLVAATAEPMDDPKRSRWLLVLPRPNLPITAIHCESPTALFQREMIVYETLTGDAGEDYRRTLGTAFWVRAPGRPATDLVVLLNSAPQSEKLSLETHNGDNPAIELEKFRVDYPVTRILFKAEAGGGLFLFYGRHDAVPPRYDLSLVAAQLLSAEKSQGQPGPEEMLGGKPWAERGKPGQGGILFWGVLGLVVLVLLVIIARLLPKTTEG